jgi:pectate lyase
VLVANVTTAVSTSRILKVPLLQQVALHGARDRHVRSPSTKTTGAKTTNQMLLLSLLSHSMFPLGYLDYYLTESSDNAGVLGITVKSNKSLIGQGSKGVIKGKGIRMVSGAKNIIVQ